MYLMYVDESGDPGITGSPSPYFVLCGLVVHEMRWKHCLDELISYRRRIRDSYGLKLREEIHSAHLVNNPGELMRIPRNKRLAIIRTFADQLRSMTDLNIINIVVDKLPKTTNYDVWEMAWMALIQRFENTISHRNFSGPANPDDQGMIFPDHTDEKRLRKLLRKMRRYNPVPCHPQSGYIGYRNLEVKRIVEDPCFKDSRQSYFVQAADLCAFLLYQSLVPNSYFRRMRAQNYHLRLDPVLCKHAAKSDPRGIVRL